MGVNTLITIKYLSGYLQWNGIKLNDSDGFSDFYSVYCNCVEIEIDQLKSVIC